MIAEPRVFLDLDGVLNSDAFVRRPDRPTDDEWDGNEHKGLDPKAVARLNEITTRSGAGLVLISSWRLVYPLDYLRTIFDRAGIVAPLFDKSPHLLGCRGSEVQAWIDKNGGRGRAFPRGGWGAPIVILDDDPDMEHLAPYHVRTTWADGLLDEHVERALRLLEAT